MAERKLRLEVLQGDEDGENGVSRVPRWHPTGQDAIITNDITGSVMKIKVTDSRGKLISIVIGKNGTIQEVKDEQTEASDPQDGDVMNWEEDSPENNQQGGPSSELTIDESCNVDLKLVKEEMVVEEAPGSSVEPYSDVVGVVSEGYKHLESSGVNAEEKDGSDVKNENMNMAGQFETVFIEPSIVSDNDETTEKNSELGNFIFGSNDQGIGIPVFCRLCATRNDEMLDIFGLDKFYKNIVDNFLPVSVKMTDYLPKQACRSCLKQLQQFRDFYESVAEAQKQFLELEEKIASEFKSLKNYPKVYPQCNGQLQAQNGNSEGLEYAPEHAPDDNRGPQTRRMRKKRETVQELNTFDLKYQSDIVKCRICGRFFSNPNTCYAHSKVHALNGYMPCSMCDKILTNRKDAEEHSMDHILPLTTYKMRDMMRKKMSDIKLNAVNSVKDAVNIIEENRRREEEKIKNSGIKCRICGALFLNPRSCYKHSLIHASGNYHPCCMCEKDFTSKTEALVHSLDHVTDCSTLGTKAPPVNTVAKKSATVNKKVPDFDLDKYLSTRSGKLLINFDLEGQKEDCDMVKCRLCGMFFGTGKSCYVHSAVHYTKDYYPCNMCDVSFTNREDSYNHSIKHTMTQFQKRRAEMIRRSISCYSEPVAPVIKVIDLEQDDAIENNKVIQKKTTKPGPDDDLVKCRICGMYFGTGKSCYAHSASHNSKDYYPCSMCEKTFTTHKDSYNHSLEHTIAKPMQRRADMIRLHVESSITATKSVNEKKDNTNEINKGQVSIEQEDGVKCRFCGLLFETVLKCYRHAKVHYLRGQYPCCMCNKTFATQGESYVHFLSHRMVTVRNVGSALEQKKRWAANNLRDKIPDQKKATEDWIQCNYCRLFFDSAATFYSHCQNHILVNDFPCCLCNESFENEADYCLHSVKHADRNLPEGKVYLPICNICGKRFPTEDRLKFHKIYHDPKTKPCFCRQCDQHFASESSLYDHIHAVHMAPPEKFECRKCKQQFESRQHLNAHLMVHKLLFECSACNSRFRTAERLKSHKLFSCHFTTTKRLKNHTCSQCGKTFLRKNSLMIHEQSHANQSKQDRDDQAAGGGLKCSRCDKTFSSATKLRKHALLHLANKQFACYGCEKSFKTEEAKREHIRISHTSETDCDVCGENFVRSSLLEKHKRVWHSHVVK